MRNYLISNATGLPVATVASVYSKESGGGTVYYGWETTDGGRTLVNSRRGRISRAKKWDGWEERNNTCLPFARELSPARFLIVEEGE